MVNTEQLYTYNFLRVIAPENPIRIFDRTAIVQSLPNLPVLSFQTSHMDRWEIFIQSIIKWYYHNDNKDAQAGY